MATIQDGYQGCIEIGLDDAGLSLMYEDNARFRQIFEDIDDFTENEYVLFYQKGAPEKTIAMYQFRNGKLNALGYDSIKSDFCGTIKPRNARQAAAIHMLHDPQTKIKLITGRWGSGKTLLMVSAAMELLQKGKFDKIVWCRNNVQVRDTDSIGALPGSLENKQLQYALCFSDHCGGVEGLERLIKDGILEIVPLAFLRGRSIRNSIIMSSESENLTKEHIQLIMGRIDSGSELWMDGDARQRDRVAFEKSKGLETMIERLAGQRLFGFVHLLKSERSEAAALADLLD